MNSSIGTALILTSIAGLATGIGSCIAFFAKRTDEKFLSFSLGLSAGVMIYISFMEILHESRINLSLLYGERAGNIYTILGFFGGVLIAALIDRVLPSFENPHEIRSVEELSGGRPRKGQGMARVGIITAFAVALHNLPEGIATFMAAMHSTELGIALAFAVAIHNIPEGIAISIPIYFATGSKRKAFFYSFLSGMTEPLGALICYLILMPFISIVTLNITLAVVAGIMIYIALDELLPASHEYGHYHISLYGVISGMLLMAGSLIMIG